MDARFWTIRGYWSGAVIVVRTTTLDRTQRRADSRDSKMLFLRFQMRSVIRPLVSPWIDNTWLSVLMPIMNGCTRDWLTLHMEDVVKWWATCMKNPRWLCKFTLLKSDGVRINLVRKRKLYLMLSLSIFMLYVMPCLNFKYLRGSAEHNETKQRFNDRDSVSRNLS